MSMDRRTFIQSGIAAGTLTSLSGYGCQPSSGDGESGRGHSEQSVESFELDEITISQLHEKISSKELSCQDVVEMYLERIEALNKNGPTLYAVLETNPDALEIAAELDQELETQGMRGPLH